MAGPPAGSERLLPPPRGILGATGDGQTLARTERPMPRDDHSRDGHGAPQARAPRDGVEAWDAEKKVVEQVASIIANKLSMLPLTKDAFLDDAVSWIWNHRSRFDPSKASFRTWCSTLLHNRGVDIIRTHARERKMKREKRYEAMNHQRRRASDRDDRDPADMLEAHLEGLNRVLVAIECQLLGRLAPDRCEAWLRHADLPTGFSWQAIEAVGNRADRRKALAAACGQNYAWVNQRIYRAIQKIRQAEGVEAGVADDGEEA